MTISNRVKSINPSQTLAITAQALKMKREGKKVISFAAGEPDFDTPKNIKEEAIAAIKQGFTHYTDNSGIIELKEAVIGKLKKDNKVEYKPAEIIISNGAKQCLFNALLTVCNPEDEVLLPTPYWVSYTEQIKFAQAVPIFINTYQEDAFKLSATQVEEKISSKTKLLILNSPNNPTGAVYEMEELKKIAQLLVKYDIYCIGDEIYEKLIYDEAEHFTIASLSNEVKAKTIIINGVSKSYAMTGWRIGYAAGPEDIISGMGKIQGHSTSNPNSIAQKASVEALNGRQETIEEMRREFDQRRKYMVEKLNQIKGVSCLKPSGAFYAFPNVSKILEKGVKYNGKRIINSFDLADFILKEAEVALIPGSAFEAEGYLRLSYATSMEDVKEGLDRIENILK
ncbi:MAG: aspartate aminotransferase [Candidatus Infernicultor aquiphilus]|uniref:Aminotransferase n=1 Tax=Candidatus Infernicultor aquiphilus TaxID=1805029 RepID=A0A1J5GKH0_9BACT|nr:pyridoxal phosphate-dependent aminotransferase [bacterium]OIP73297.1 MAG: aspartate aminotransferase [Candidatus Atribacteria bacterium CG2_30_33_13]PIU25650.1 MAG: aspartate aminotransferase [Candidatus Atribacteria bacterium CG08_land_8_20_14_0_20_33_29]PIX34021.1 MAG: aspartate aminotransferase [Candidatus Atribacteria bacterium CG_4_8_14_3_um_filter_34_18]PIY31887.1 MAG: aspartate aminotransferase [Candidatus Atribacteria bacterium CG_4_10_14_3_um_filter_34_13]PJB58176.1 MAG: aspartate 